MPFKRHIILNLFQNEFKFFESSRLRENVGWIISPKIP